MKKCTICKEEKPKSDFYKNKSRKDGLQNKCKECSSKKTKEHYKDNKQYYLDRSKDQKLRNKKFIYNYLLGKVCNDCNQKFPPECMDFDHVNGDKTDSVCRMAGMGVSINKLKKEILKCEIRCANCHRIKTAKTHGWYKWGSS